MSIMARLRQETQLCHEQVEKLLYAGQIQNGTLTTEQYIQLLSVNYVFHQSLEAAIKAVDNDYFAGYKPEQRIKTNQLLRDLQTLQLPIPTEQRMYFQNWTNAQLLGAAYVAEGSTLGGRVINKYLQKNRVINPVASQSSFYTGYGEQTGSMWQEFCAYLTQQHGSHEDLIIKGALDAFALYEEIFHSLPETTGSVAAL